MEHFPEFYVPASLEVLLFRLIIGGIAELDRTQVGDDDHVRYAWIYSFHRGMGKAYNQ